MNPRFARRVDPGAARGAGRPKTWRNRAQDPRWLLSGLALSLVLFLLALSPASDEPPPVESPTPAAVLVPVGKPDPTSVRLRAGEFLRVDLRPAVGDRYATVVSESNLQSPVLEQTSAPAAAPMLRALRGGAVVVTVLLEPKCPPEGICREYRRNLGAIRVTVED